MRKIGITGGVGSGKSLVLNWFGQMDNTFICQADLVAHELQKPGNVCYNKIVEQFGKNILNENGEIDRGKLGQIVFANTDLLNKLNEITHPEVNAHIVKLMELSEKQGVEYFILEAALLHEPFYREILDEIWYIHVTEDVRRERLALSRGYSKEKTTSIMEKQPTEDCFMEISDRVIENSSSFDDTIIQLKKALNI